MSEDIVMMGERQAGMPDQCPMMGVGFYVKPIQNAKKSKEAGHPVFEDREWIKIVTPGDRNSWVERVATDKDRQTYPRTYGIFKNAEKKTQAVEGFRIEEWPQVTRAMAWTLKAANIFTVEQLATVSDGNIDKIGHSGRELRSKAQAFVEVSKNSAAAHQFKAESDKKDMAIADLQRQLNELSAKFEKRGPGRPAHVNAA